MDTNTGPSQSFTHAQTIHLQHNIGSRTTQTHSKPSHKWLRADRNMNTDARLFQSLPVHKLSSPSRQPKRETLVFIFTPIESHPLSTAYSPQQYKHLAISRLYLYTKLFICKSDVNMRHYRLFHNQSILIRS